MQRWLIIAAAVVLAAVVVWSLLDSSESGTEATSAIADTSAPVDRAPVVSAAATQGAISGRVVAGEGLVRVAF